jgi:ethanolamine utilization protein EutN
LKLVPREKFLVQLARVIGHAVSTIKHPSLKGWRLVVVQPQDALGLDDGEPLLAIDYLGANPCGLVIVSNDGATARELVQSRQSPARWFVLGIVDR